MFGSGGKDRRIAQLEAELRHQRRVIEELSARLGVDPESVLPDLYLDATERQLLADGRKVSALRHHRERTGSSLIEAKNAVDRYLP